MNPESETPQSIRAELLRYGGKNYLGKPFWRLILAERRIVKRGGIFNIFAAGTSQFDFSNSGRYQYNPVKPESTKTGIHEVPMYPVHGWILERWFPPDMIGTKSWWNEQKGADGSSLLGDYPAEGIYWMISGPWPKLPSLEVLRAKIRGYEYAMDLNAENPEQRMKDYIEACEKADDKTWDDDQAQRQYAHRHIVKPLMNGLSLGAQRERQRILNSHGILSHIPAGGNL